jgi:type 1 fimbriae regulatory protein FimB/type 1 fimbriae regulatory protein FimE
MLRSREHLSPGEIDRLIAAAKQSERHGHRDATMILRAYRHGLRVSELVAMRREQVDLQQGQLHVRRCKSGLPILTIVPLSRSKNSWRRYQQNPRGARTTLLFAASCDE